MDIVRETHNILFATLRPTKLNFLADLTSPYPETVTNGLLSLSHISEQVLRDEARPYVFLAVPLRSLFKLLTKIAGTLERLSVSNKDASKEFLRSLYSRGISGDLPEYLGKIQLWLDVSRDRCEIAAWARGNVVPELEALRRPLGLIRPPRFVWWRVRAWDQSPEVKWRQSLFALTYETFDLMGRYCDAIEQAHHSGTAYANLEGIFRPVDRLISSGDQQRDEFKEESLLSLRDTLEEFQLILQRVDDAYRLQRESYLPHLQRAQAQLWNEGTVSVRESAPSLIS